MAARRRDGVALERVPTVSWRVSGEPGESGHAATPEAFERVIASDVRYRFVVDTSTLA